MERRAFSLRRMSILRWPFNEKFVIGVSTMDTAQDYLVLE